MPAGISPIRNIVNECDRPTNAQPAAAIASPTRNVRSTPSSRTIGATIPTWTMTPRKPNAARTYPVCVTSNPNLCEANSANVVLHTENDAQ